MSDQEDHQREQRRSLWKGPRVNTTVTTATAMISILSMDSVKSASGEERAKNIPIV
jgi:hypothetical protein